MLVKHSSNFNALLLVIIKAENLSINKHKKATILNTVLTILNFLYSDCQVFKDKLLVKIKSHILLRKMLISNLIFQMYRFQLS